MQTFQKNINQTQTDTQTVHNYIFRQKKKSENKVPNPPKGFVWLCRSLFFEKKFPFFPFLSPLPFPHLNQTDKKRRHFCFSFPLFKRRYLKNPILCILRVFQIKQTLEPPTHTHRHTYTNISQNNFRFRL